MGRKREDIFRSDIVDEIYDKLQNENFSRRRIVVLEFSSYFELYLWKWLDFNHENPPSIGHIMSCLVMINEKIHQNIPIWSFIAENDPQEKFAPMFERVLDLALDTKIHVRERTCILQFLIHCFQALEQDFVRENCLKLTMPTCWWHLNPTYRESLLANNARLQKTWKKIVKKYTKPKSNMAKHRARFHEYDA